MDRKERVEKMKAMRYEQGKTLEEIGEAFGGISRERVRQLIGNSGQVTYAMRRELYWKNRHLPTKELAALLGVKVDNIYGYRRRYSA